MEIIAICKIDVDLYRRVTPDIITEDVVITEKQIAHIRERHFSDYDRFSGYLPEILTAPDYLLEANKPHTTLILKRIQENGEDVKLVLRLAVKTDDPDYKNSIITFMRIKDKDWKRLVKNKKVLYKRE